MLTDANTSFTHHPDAVSATNQTMTTYSIMYASAKYITRFAIKKNLPISHAEAFTNTLNIMIVTLYITYLNL
jgi:hypothetical protein